MLKLSQFSLVSLLTFALFTVLFAFLAASPAAALTTICDGDCAIVDDAFDFGLGLEADPGDKKIKLMTTGNVYVVGPISASKGTKLSADDIIFDDDLGSNGKVKSKVGKAFKGNGRSGNNGKGKVMSDGDIYLDVSDVDLKKLQIKAGGQIVVSDESLPISNPIPEPTTALLVGLGLTGLAIRGKRSAA